MTLSFLSINILKSFKVNIFADYLQSMKVKSESHTVVSNSLQPHGLHSPWKPPGQNTGVGSLSLLQGIFQTQGLKWVSHIAG